MNLLQVSWERNCQGMLCWPWAWGTHEGHTRDTPGWGSELLLFHQEHPPTPSCSAIMLNLKLLTNQPHKPWRSTWLFLTAVILEESWSFTQTDGLCSHVQCIGKKTVKFLKPWWTATVFMYPSSQLNTLQQGTVVKTPISPSSTARTGQWFISIGSVIFRTQLTPPKRTKEFWETWFSGKLHFFYLLSHLHWNTSQPCTTEEASLSPANCNSCCLRTKLSLFRASTLQLLYQIYVLL